MEPLLIILVPGIAGGILLAFYLAHRPVRPAVDAPAVRRALPPTSPSLINMARIQIDGVGGLGMVAMALAVAISVPWIRLSIAVSLVLGGHAAYRTQLFCYLKSCGRQELGTMNLWAGMDAPMAPA